MIVGISPGTTQGHLARATLEGIVFSIRDFVEAMSTTSGYDIKRIAVDGGASRNDLLCQFQANHLAVEVVRPKNTEATSAGAALLAGLAVGVWPDTESALAQQDVDATFHPALSEEERVATYKSWTRAVSKVKGWAKP